VFTAVCAAGAAIALLFVASRGRVEHAPMQARVPAASQKVPGTSPRVPEASPEVPEMPARVPGTSTRVPAPIANRFVEESLKEDPLVVDSIAIAPINPESIAVIELPPISPIAVDPLGSGEQK
jgi:hypothetical protein